MDTKLNSTPLFDIVRDRLVAQFWNKFNSEFHKDHDNSIDEFVLWCLCILTAENMSDSMSLKEYAQMIKGGVTAVNTPAAGEEAIKNLCCGDFNPWALTDEYRATNMTLDELLERLDVEDDWIAFRDRVIEFCS